MKKTLAFILVCALLVSAFTLTAFADTKKLVGDHDNGTGVGQGDTWPTPPQGNGEIKVQVDQVVHKYAVDLDYTVPSYALPEITWDVKALKYTYDPAFDSKFDENVTLIVTNYSDLTVNAEVTLDSTAAKAEAGFTFEWQAVTGDYTGTVTTTAAKVLAATTNTTNIDGTAGVARKVTFALDVNVDLVKAALAYEGMSGAQTIATYTVTVAK